jgi:peroxin-19
MMGGSGGGLPEGGGDINKVMEEFSKFLKDSEGNEDMKSALDSVVNELLTKETLYEPMLVMRETYPPWLETNWDKVSQK